MIRGMRVLCVCASRHRSTDEIADRLVPGNAKTDSERRDIREKAQPKEIAEFVPMIHPRAHRVFWGALDAGQLGLGARLARLLPAARAMMPEGDLRDWADVDDWAHAIANELPRSKDLQ